MYVDNPHATLKQWLSLLHMYTVSEWCVQVCVYMYAHVHCCTCVLCSRVCPNLCSATRIIISSIYIKHAILGPLDSRP